ncbi:hypothetical protein PAPHI01_0924 [Pancytospora philotis]|nr:hypothetical protein PAPHI01_0924 [Pancytospora philotis]
MRSLAKMLSCSVLLVAARLDVDAVVRALGERHPGGVFVDPEGPLNILCGHPLLNNDMVTKKRKYAALVRTAYSYTSDASELKSEYTRDVRNDGIRELGSSTAAMQYLKAYYKALEAMFTVVDGAAVVNEAVQTTFLRCLTPEKRLKLYAVLLVLAGGGDIRVMTQSHESDGCEAHYRVCFFIADTNKALLELYLNPVEDDDASAVFRFFGNYGGNKVGEVESYGLHYTDSPSFLIQAYLSESIECEEDAVEVFKGAREILVKLRDGGFNGKSLWERFFTDSGELAWTYGPGYAAISEIHRDIANTCSTFSQNAQPQQGCCANLRAMERMGRLLPRVTGHYQHPDFLKLCCSLCFDPVTGSCSAERIRSAGVNPSEEFIEMLCKRPELFDFSSTYDDWEGVMYALQVDLFESSPQQADLVRFDGFGRLEKDLGNYLMVLAKLFGFSADDMNELSEQLLKAVKKVRGGRSCEDLNACIRVLLDKYSLMRVCGATCVGLKARDGRLCGTLRLEFGLRQCADAPCVFHIELVVTERDAKFYYNPQSFVLSDDKRASLEAMIEELPAWSESSLSALLWGCVKRFIGKSDCELMPDSSAAFAFASDDPLKIYVALNEWMERSSMQSYGEVLAAADHLLPLFELHLDNIRKCDEAEREAQLEHFASGPLVAVIDNILGNAILSDEAARRPLFNILRHCVNERAKLFPSISLPEGSYPRMYKSLYGSDAESSLACLAHYDVPNMLLGQLKLRAVAGLSKEQRAEFCERSAEFVAEPWRDLVHPVLATFFRLEDAKGMEFLREHCLPKHGDTSEEGYCKKAFWISLASCASPAIYHNAIREACNCWADPLCELPGSVLAFLALQKIRKPEPLSMALLNEVFSNRPTESRYQAITRIFEIYAGTSTDYEGIREVLQAYRERISVERTVYDNFLRARSAVLIRCYDDHCSALLEMKQYQALLEVAAADPLKHHLSRLSSRNGIFVDRYKYWNEVAKTNETQGVVSDSAPSHPAESQVGDQ